jgi:hypothetical protein
MNLMKEAIAWVKRGPEAHEVVQIVPDVDWKGEGLCYDLYTAYEPAPDHLGRILFDAAGYWIYDGQVLQIVEQEQVAKFIMNYVEVI